MTALKNAKTGLTLFDFKGTPLRVVEIERAPWFIAREVASLLDLSPYADGTPNVTNATRSLDKAEKHLLRRSTPHLTKGSLDEIFTRQQPSLLLISESGLYKMVMRADKPDAKEFQNWVTQEVLPSIRKDGGYVMGEEKLATGEMTEDQFILTAMRMMEDKVARYRAAICHEVSMR